ncbi:hypothetical protein FKM82_023168 [Ascaphus truei]
MPPASMEHPRFYGRRNPLASAVPVMLKKRKAVAVSTPRQKRQAKANKENLPLTPKTKGFHRRKPHYVKKIYSDVLSTQNEWQPAHQTRRPLPAISFDDSAVAVPEILSPSSPPPSSPVLSEDATASEIHGSLSPLLLDDSASRPEIQRSLSPSLFDDAAASPLPGIHRSPPALFLDVDAASVHGTPISSSVAPIPPDVQTPCRSSSLDRILNGISVDLPGNSIVLAKIDLLLETMLNMEQRMLQMD